ncbi:MAG: copper chaperone PCu(A)C [Oscillochloris sp.]|nr:copper chaperone PCu(A)C [Oscillochloris sp.]
MRRSIALLLWLFGLVLAACAAPTTTTAMEIRDPWVRAAVNTAVAEDAMAGMEHGDNATNSESGETTAGMNHGGESMPAGGNSAAYMVLVSSGNADRLLSASTDAATTVEIHETQIDDGVMRMRPLVDGLAIPAGGQVELKPGGYHIMLMGLTGDLDEGEQITLTLNFEQAGAIEVQAPVRMP